MNNTIKLGKAPAKHLYEVEVRLEDGKRITVDVLANTSTQANSIAKKAGYNVCSVNMVG